MASDRKRMSSVRDPPRPREVYSRIARSSALVYAGQSACFQFQRRRGRTSAMVWTVRPSSLRIGIWSELRGARVLHSDLARRDECAMDKSGALSPPVPLLTRVAVPSLRETRALLDIHSSSLSPASSEGWKESQRGEWPLKSPP